MSKEQQIYQALKAAQSALNQIINTRLSGEHPDSYAVASLVDAAVKEAEQPKFYDVCNDYSLDPCEAPDLTNYKAEKAFVTCGIEDVPVTIYIERHDLEIHYLSATADAPSLKGFYCPDED